MDRKFKYMRDDFKPLPVKLEHLDIYLKFEDQYVEATNTLYMIVKEELSNLVLDAKELEILQVKELVNKNQEHDPREVFYDKPNSKLIVTLNPKTVGEKIILRTKTRCFPSENILEGIYKDFTPPGAPQQYMSQCQQWGFQRILKNIGPLFLSL